MTLRLFVQQQAREAVTQGVGRRLVDLRCLARGVEGAAAPGLVGRLGPRSGAVVGEHERVPRRAAARERPFGRVCSEWREEPDGAVDGGLGVSVLAERERARDQQRVVADVVPLQREPLTETQARVGEDGEERGVALGGRCAHPFYGGRREPPDLLAARQPRATDEADRVGGDALGFDVALEDPEKVERLAYGGGSGAGGQPVGLPARDRLRTNVRSGTEPSVGAK
jgi:hypothetical protein